jgi:hypothetical protein
MHALFLPEFVVVDASVDVVKRNAHGEVDSISGAVEVIADYGWPEVRSYYVSLDVFRANLQSLGPIGTSIRT